MQFQLIKKPVFDALEKTKINELDKLALLADMCRLNTLTEVKKAGSGHLGTSFSAMDLVIYLYYKHLNVRTVGIDDPNRDIYFSSKGHDAPGLYAVLYALGILPEEKLLKLRRLGGLDGHPDVKIPGIEANTGSLGMGISKGRGMKVAKEYLKHKGKVFVLVGDGEFQEGQNFEGLQVTAHQGVNDLIVIMDHNKLQSDRMVDQIVSLGNLEEKISAFGWHVLRCDGHDMKAIEKTILAAEKIKDKPKFIIADTIKGRGVSFMEHPEVLKANDGYYKFHAGAPDDETFERAFDELKNKITKQAKKLGFDKFELTALPEEEKKPSGVSPEFVAAGFGEALCDLAEKNKEFVVLDADLSADCRIIAFERRYPKRFIECGIAEQDMVSMAAGLAAQGTLPIVNSFGTFLAARPNEQIYNAATEGRRIIYACHFAGMIPAAPGKSHQSVRDISLFGALPNMEIIQASGIKEMKMVIDYAINKTKNSCMLRVNIGPSPRIIDLPTGYKLELGKGAELTSGKDLVLFAYGPVMLNEALKAQEIVKEHGVELKVVNMPWLNRFDRPWLDKILDGCEHLFVLEDHSPFGGLADNLIDFYNRSYGKLPAFKLTKLAVEGFPACGTPAEALRFHRLDGVSLAERIMEGMNSTPYGG